MPDAATRSKGSITADPQNHIAFLQRVTFPSTRKYVEDILTMRYSTGAISSIIGWYREFFLTPARR